MKHVTSLFSPLLVLRLILRATAQLQSAQRLLPGVRGSSGRPDDARLITFSSNILQPPPSPNNKLQYSEWLLTSTSRTSSRRHTRRSRRSATANPSTSPSGCPPQPSPSPSTSATAVSAATPMAPSAVSTPLYPKASSPNLSPPPR